MKMVATSSDGTCKNERVKNLGLRAWHQGAKPFWVRIAPVLVTGRRLPKAWQYPEPTDS